MPNMAITVEPSIYITENSACDKKWWNMAVGIEDTYSSQKMAMT
jgi:Xaa-Pro aminopeptidase